LRSTGHRAENDEDWSLAAARAAKKAGEEIQVRPHWVFSFRRPSAAPSARGSLFGRPIFLLIILLGGFFRNGSLSAGTCSVSEKSISKGDTKHDDARNP
jgi:hypothetical protein